MMSKQRTLVMIPTYNESENVEVIASGILSTGVDADLLFVDDDSPDGTGAILDRMGAECPRLRVLHRPEKLGIGSAHKAGIQWAYQHGYTRLLTMDSDLSHSPSDIPRLLAASDDSDVVVGSRFVEANSLEGWTWTRKLMTHLGHWSTTVFLHLPQDCTNAFRVYQLDRIPADVFEKVQSTSYSFFLESLDRLNVSGFRILAGRDQAAATHLRPFQDEVQGRRLQRRPHITAGMAYALQSPFVDPCGAVLRSRCRRTSSTGIAAARDDRNKVDTRSALEARAFGSSSGIRISRLAAPRT